MQRTFQRSNGNCKPSESFSSRLNAYALAASAAGVTMLACSVPGEGEAVCVLTNNVSLTGSATYQLYLPGQNVPSFNIAQTWANFSSQSFYFWNRGFFIPNTAGASAVLATNGFPAALSVGAAVGSGAKFGKGNSYGLLFTYGPSGGGTRNHHQGNFTARTNYVGFKFSVSGQTHFGWARMRVTLGPGGYGYTVATTIHLPAYGFETIPNKAIQVNENCKDNGQPVRADTTPQSNSGTASSGQQLSGRTLSVVGTRVDALPPSLGALALGSKGLFLWRK
jgi:hypothetical protein